MLRIYNLRAELVLVVVFRVMDTRLFAEQMTWKVAAGGRAGVARCPSGCVVDFM